MSDKTTTYSGGVSASSLLGVAFIVLKLCGVINWSWWWITAPFWGPLAFIATILCVPLIVAGLYMLLAAVLEGFHKLRK